MTSHERLVNRLFHAAMEIAATDLDFRSVDKVGFDRVMWSAYHMTVKRERYADDLVDAHREFKSLMDNPATYRD